MEKRKQEELIVWYPFDEKHGIGEDISGNGKNAEAMGSVLPCLKEVDGKMAACFAGGASGSSYLALPEDLLAGISDNTGFSVSAWVYLEKGQSVWERIFDFGQGESGPYVFLTRNLRGVVYAESDLACDIGKGLPQGQWGHVVFTVSGTEGGSLSSAGPRIYLNGELWADGLISQTSSGNYKSLRNFWKLLEEPQQFVHNYIGKSQFGADADFCGAISDFRIYKKALSENEILGQMCENLNEEDMLALAKEKYLPAFPHIVTDNMVLPASLLDGRVTVSWEACGIDASGVLEPVKEPFATTLTASLTCGSCKDEKKYQLTIMPKEIAPYELTIEGCKKGVKISDTLYGLFFEDINHSADGGIYAEMIQNRSFEEFTFSTYDARSGENGSSTGRNRDPLKFWFGDIDKTTVHLEGGLNEHFGITDPDTNACYVEVAKGASLINRGFCDLRYQCAMNLRQGEKYFFSIWAKADEEDTNTAISVTLCDEGNIAVSATENVIVTADGKWKKYACTLVANKSTLGQICLSFQAKMCIDMVSLMPEWVWGANEETESASAHRNFLANPNYRLRRDLVKSLMELHPKFLRFPGGCISEGSYIWDNVYDWKDSVGAVELRKENFNVWGYTMTLGLGYMEYFQLAEDLGAEPLPVMACGVLCQARSDYANPAGGSLRDKYIKNFTDLIDFALSEDFENNTWAALRRDMGHAAPFGLHYLGVGNENWGTEFYANFEKFYHEIKEYVKKNYKDHDLTVISTAGAQADDDAYQNGWRFLCGKEEGGARIAFTDGSRSWEEDCTWYEHQDNYLETIVDEHFYRSNEYLLENADRYNYYHRPMGTAEEVESSIPKVFIGEYASSDKNTLAGAVAEAAVMTGFETNSDVVRLAATAPLFNKVGGDGTYRWTPDCIWFDDEKVWRTPNYYVQQMFAENIGDHNLKTSYATYLNGQKKEMKPEGDVAVFLKEDVELLGVSIAWAKEDRIELTGQELMQLAKEQERSKETESLIENHGVSNLSEFFAENQEVSKLAELLAEGLEVLHLSDGYYIKLPDKKNKGYQLMVEAKAIAPMADFSFACGVSGMTLAEIKEAGLKRDRISMHEYCIGKPEGTGLKVYKDGKQAYTMGDYSSSVYAGNERKCYLDKLKEEEVISGVVDFACEDEEKLLAWYEVQDAKGNKSEKKALLNARLFYYCRDLYHSVTEDDDMVYVKLVNADHYPKKTKLIFKDLMVKTGEAICLCTEDTLLNVQNVNTKEKEWVAPTKQQLAVENGELEMLLPADSVHVLAMKKG